MYSVNINYINAILVTILHLYHVTLNRLANSTLKFCIYFDYDIWSHSIKAIVGVGEKRKGGGQEVYAEQRMFKQRYSARSSLGIPWLPVHSFKR